MLVVMAEILERNACNGCKLLGCIKGSQRRPMMVRAGIDIFRGMSSEDGIDINGLY